MDEQYWFQGMKKKRFQNMVRKPAARRYTFRDFSPTKKDPRCHPDWPLAAYWPVYLGNFKIVLDLYDNYSDDLRNERVRQYFLSKGLPTFMIFHLKNDSSSDYLKDLDLYDMLVYFCSKEDADIAIAKCHQDDCYSHKIHVYDGRTPERFPPETTCRFEHLELVDTIAMEMTIAKYMKTHLPVESVRKIDLDGTYVQLSRPLTPTEAETAMNIPRFRKMPIPEQAQKQRFIEGDVIDEIMNEIHTNPYFLSMRPTDRVMGFLMRGEIPTVPITWKSSNPDRDQLFESQMIKAWQDQTLAKKRKESVKPLSNDQPTTSQQGGEPVKPQNEEQPTTSQQGSEALNPASQQQPTNPQQDDSSVEPLSKKQKIQ